MLTAITIAVVILAMVASFLFVARRVFRLALKFALVGALVIMLFAIGATGWWRGWFSAPSKPPHPQSQPNQRANSNPRSNSNRRPPSR